MTTPNINQFAISTVQGEPDLQFIGSVVSARVSANQATALVAGQPVKIENSGAQGLPSVLAMASNLDTPWGIVLRNLKDQQFNTLAAVEVARDNSVVYLPAAAAIARGAPVQIDYAAFTVSTWTGGSQDCIGEAFDQAVNVGDLIRVWIRLPRSGNIDRGVLTQDITATLAQINAGTVLIPGVAGQSIRVLGVAAKVTGAFATTTSVELESSTTNVAVLTYAVAGLTNGAVLQPWTANVTDGVGFGGFALPAGEGLSVANNGAAATGGTNIEFVITFQQF